jgi:N-glycosylase/DNA lyase
LRGLSEARSKYLQEVFERVASFKKTREEYGKVLEELVFCLCTPQTKARNALNAVEALREHCLLQQPDRKKVEEILRKANVRFHRKKACYIVDAVGKFEEIWQALCRENSAHALRDYLVNNVAGLGMKEASHFLRNIGFTEIAVIDRHILKHLKAEGLVRKIHKNITRRRYLLLEKKFIELAAKHGLSPAELDLLVWASYTGEVLK